MRWLEYVTEFDFEIEHHDGNSACMLPADALSRTPPETKEIGSNVITSLQGIKKPFWVKYGVSTVEVNKAQQSDTQLIGLKGHWKQIGNRIKIIDDVMYVRFTDDRRHDTYKVIIPDSMVTEIFDFYHFPEHFARERMMHKLRGKYYVFKLLIIVSKSFSSILFLFCSLEHGLLASPCCLELNISSPLC